MNSAEVLLKQNEEIFKKMSEDFDELAKSIEQTNGNHVFLAKSLRSLKEDLDSIPKEVSNQLELTSKIVETLKKRSDDDHNKFSSLCESFEIERKSNSIKIEKAINQLNDSISSININHETLITENKDIRIQLEDFHQQVSLLTKDCEFKIARLDEKFILEQNKQEKKILEKLDDYNEKAENEYTNIKTNALEQNRLTNSSLENVLNEIHLLKKQSNKFKNLFYLSFVTMGTTFLVIYFILKNGLV